MTDKESRINLYERFKTGAKPSEQDFKYLIDSALNRQDDGIEKPPGADTPLKISAHGEAENLLDFYAGETHTWRLNQQPETDRTGLNFSTGGQSKLFIESSTGHLGLGTTNPEAKLHIQQSDNQNALQINNEQAKPLVVDAEGKLGIGKNTPQKRLDVDGDAGISGTLSVSEACTLTGNVGIGAAPGNTKLTVAGNTSISGTLSVTGSGNSSFSGGLTVNGDLSLKGSSINTGKAVMIGAANDYTKAQFALSGGGTITWGGPGGKLNWTQRFIAISVGKNPSVIKNGHISIYLPTEAIPSENTPDNQTRAVAEGIILKAWEALYAVHEVGQSDRAITFRIIHYNQTIEVPSNWILIGVVNAEDSTIKLGNGVTLSKNSSSTKGSPIPTGVIMMWHGASNQIPDGWALCNGQNGTPNLRDRFVVGAGGKYSVDSTGGADEVRLTIDQMPSHNHANRSYKYLLQKTNRNTSGDQDNSKDEPDVKHAGQIATQGKNQPHENRPPYYALCYIMKL